MILNSTTHLEEYCHFVDELQDFTPYRVHLACQILACVFSIVSSLTALIHRIYVRKTEQICTIEMCLNYMYFLFIIHGVVRGSMEISHFSSIYVYDKHCDRLYENRVCAPIMYTFIGTLIALNFVHAAICLDIFMSSIKIGRDRDAIRRRIVQLFLVLSSLVTIGIAVLLCTTFETNMAEKLGSCGWSSHEGMHFRNVFYIIIWLSHILVIFAFVVLSSYNKHISTQSFDLLWKHQIRLNRKNLSVLLPLFTLHFIAFSVFTLLSLATDWIESHVTNLVIAKYFVALAYIPSYYIAAAPIVVRVLVGRIKQKGDSRARSLASTNQTSRHADHYFQQIQDAWKIPTRL